MVHNLLKHLEYLNQRKAELEKLDKHKLISLLIVAELAVKEYDKEQECTYCEGKGEVDMNLRGVDANICHECNGTGKKGGINDLH